MSFVLDLDLEPLPEGTTPLAAIVAVKYLCPDCTHAHLAFQYSTDLDTWEAVGMAEAALAMAKMDMLQQLLAVRGGEEEDE